MNNESKKSKVIPNRLGQNSKLRKSIHYLLPACPLRRIEASRRGRFTVHSRRAGFTLIELMVVVVILGLLAAIVVPRFIGRVGPAKQKAASAQIELLGTALDSFRLDVGRYPTTSEGLQALITKPSDAEDWNGPYLKKQEIPLDPWGNPYHYESPGSHGDYDLYSYGADNAEGGDSENQDIVSWKGLK